MVFTLWYINHVKRSKERNALMLQVIYIMKNIYLPCIQHKNIIIIKEDSLTSIFLVQFLEVNNTVDYLEFFII